MPTAQSSANIVSAETGSAAAKIGRIAGVVAIAVIVFASLYFALLYLAAQ
jgi:hypothetical protein